MSYEPPSYAILQKSTRELQQTFNDLTKRYTTLSYEQLCAGVERLEELYKEKVVAKHSWWSKPAPDPLRLNQIGCITQLMLCKPLPIGVEVTESEAKKYATQKDKFFNTLMGALLYRFLRLIESYSGLTGMYGFFGSAATNCALAQALESFLKITAKNPLDDLTIAICGKAYLDHLTQNGVADEFKYVKSDPEFFIKLQEIVKTSTQKSKPMGDQLKYIVCIQSVNEVIAQYLKQMKLVITTLETKLKTILDTQELTKEEVVLLLQEIQKPEACIQFLQNYILSSINNEAVINLENLASFKRQLEKNLEIYSQYALLGSYILTMDHVQMPDSPLHSVLKYSTAMRPDNLLDKEAQTLALTSLSRFIDTFPEFVLINTEIWEGFSVFKAELTRQLIKLEAVESNGVETELQELTFTM